MVKNIKLQPVPPQMQSSHYQLGYQGSIVPPMALAEAQVVILYVFWDKIQLHRPICALYDSSNDYHLRISIV